MTIKSLPRYALGYGLAFLVFALVNGLSLSSWAGQGASKMQQDFHKHKTLLEQKRQQMDAQGKQPPLNLQELKQGLEKKKQERNKPDSAD